MRLPRHLPQEDGCPDRKPQYFAAISGFGRSFWPLVLGRTLTGVYTGLVCVSINTYIGEISYHDIRGMLGTSFQFMLGAGIVYAYSFGAFTDWDDLAFICCVPPVVFCVLVFFNPESPAFLVANGKTDSGREALQKLRGPSWDVSAEMKAIEARASEANNHKTTFKDLLSPQLLRPLVIVLGVMIFQQLCGINALVFNLDTIFKSAGSNMSASVSSIVVSVVQTLATLLAYFFVDTMGRKLLLIISAIFMGVGHGLVGLFFYLLEIEEVWTQQHLEWLPLLAVVIFQLAFSIGYGPVPWIMMGEMFPDNVRETASSLATVTNWTASFFVIFSFEPLQASLPTYWFYWLFTCLCILATIFSAMVVVETKGKTIEEIGTIFAKKSSSSPEAGQEVRFK
ncbi:Sugar/inositol transporter [Trinorchestia longiramus]|nr:Sugar/inositol transporter [Trinorchestia longiramus]